VIIKVMISGIVLMMLAVTVMVMIFIDYLNTLVVMWLLLSYMIVISRKLTERYLYTIVNQSLH